MKKLENRLSWLIGGAQGSGVDSSANIFARACAYGGLHVYGKREYYSNIKGRHSYFQVRVDEREIHSAVDHIDFLVTFDAETVARHYSEVPRGGGIIYDPALVHVRLADIPTLDSRLLDELTIHISQLGLKPTVGALVEDAIRMGIVPFPVPYNQLLQEIGKKVGESQLSKLTRMVNVMAVAASFGLLGYDKQRIAEAITSVFEGKKKVIDLNIIAANHVYDWALRTYGDVFPVGLHPIPADEDRIMLVGNQAIALGKLAGGLRFQTYYPITPASDESDYIEENQMLQIMAEATLPAHMQPNGAGLQSQSQRGACIVMQAEDEIAAVTMAIGASLAGVRSATATSGPGFSLMMEGLGWASINEVPLVITLYQRGGPSTGMPTRQEQGDLMFALHAGHGESPRIILSSGDLEESFYDSIRAFNYAEKYQMPVIHLVDKALANSNATVKIFDPKYIRIQRGNIVSEEALEKSGNHYARFAYGENGISQRAVLGEKGGIFWNTGDEHDEHGHVTEDPVIRRRMMDKRMGKLEVAAREIPDNEKFTLFGEKDDPQVTVVSWGSNKGAILDAIERLSGEGARVQFLHVRLLNPFPSDRVKRILDNAKITIDVEANYSGQLASLIAEKTGHTFKHLVVKYTGRPISEDEMYQAMNDAIHGRLEQRRVLTYGA
jgi:2-oxoglutarate ferredoxin oxidoreductase subunit alpha